jgi:hypothetical protein
MADASTDSARWDAARTTAAQLAETGVDPLDVQAAEAARSLLVRRFVLDLLLIFGVVALVGAVTLLVTRGVQGDDALSGRELWIATGALLLLLAVVAVRTILPARAAAYEKAWNGFVERVWPGAAKGDEMGAARLAFVKQVSSGGAKATFPATAPGRRAK